MSKNTPIKEKLGKNVRELIMHRNLKNKTELATLIGANHKTVYDIYNDIGNPTLETLATIAKKLNVPTWFLIQDTLSITTTDIQSTEKLLSLASKLNSIELAQAIDEIEKILKYKKLRETLSVYEPTNPLLNEIS